MWVASQNLVEGLGFDPYRAEGGVDFHRDALLRLTFLTHPPTIMKADQDPLLPLLRKMVCHGPALHFHDSFRELNTLELSKPNLSVIASCGRNMPKLSVKWLSVRSKWGPCFSEVSCHAFHAQTLQKNIKFDIGICWFLGPSAIAPVKEREDPFC